jgi:hypothetical protein
MGKKALFVLIDGVGDVTIPSLGKTPLQQANIPNLDKLAGKYDSLVFFYFFTYYKYRKWFDGTVGSGGTWFGLWIRYCPHVITWIRS